MFLVPCFWASISIFSGIFLPIFLLCSQLLWLWSQSPLSRFWVSFPCREQGVSVPAESKGTPAESKGYTLRCSGDLLCAYLRGCRGEEEKPELERVVVTSSWTGRSITGLRHFRRALQRHFLVDLQTEDIAGKIISCSKRACFAFVNRTRNGWTAVARSLPTHRFRDGSKTEAASVRGTAASFVNQYSKPRYHRKDLFLL